MRILSIFALFFCSQVLADGIVVDKVYHPYVLPNETEFEWRMLSRQTDEGNLLGQRIAFGKSLNESLMLEAYLVGEKTETEDFSLQAYEVELRWMVTEQGEQWADWGMLFELEKLHQSYDWEFTTGVLFEKEFGRTSLTMNAFVVYEWGENIEDELETEFRLKYRYRWIPELQPAIEIYSGEELFGIGPAFMGIYRIDRQKQLKWEAGFISEISQSGKDHSFRLALEYEF
ncbi:hypothetical protein tloyanaT_03380 [Thalassotalea loyana]|uniref:Copper resistance protein B n=1 Tax=Thalassotalea loyana TaxID=280483 RepID=A0ABQ6H7H2_9GAMM|nr:hypothetical protein [Thalassotalea loyana]GLX84086.1 hypothetical protein tloyanaT_03380 [Thalassotalea loyana]